ncbi:hypothetical protein [Psychrobacter sp. I-STPA10]|uniref:hypothetical protein n=1 Tax=Psychrobacter sp. I-STPA10 TaxID=2585769 RepID=UPI001E49CCF9|nr:hypothetical protein [Psychrobacter sp. I-STPA10]
MSKKHNIVNKKIVKKSEITSCKKVKVIYEDFSSEEMSREVYNQVIRVVKNG